MPKNISLLFLGSFLSLFAADAVPPQPVYIYLYARIDDHINTELTAERLQRTLKLVAGLRQKNPGAGASALVQFSGATAQVLADQNAKTGLVTLVRKYQREGVVEIGYHGANEPAYNAWPPLPTGFRARNGMDRWNYHLALFSSFFADYRDPLTGQTDPKRPGGLREVRKVFGPLAALSGISGTVGGDPEADHLLGRDRKKAVVFGLTDPDPEHKVEGYAPAAQAFARLIAPAPDTSPEIYWLDDVLHSSEFAGRPVVSVDASKGTETLQKLLAALDRTRPHVLHVELSSERLYLTEEYAKRPNYPPVRYAYAHAQQPKLPAEALRPPADAEAGYQRQEDLLQFLTGEFFPANPGSRFVSTADLLHMTPPGAGTAVNIATVTQAAANLLKRWGNDTNTPGFVTAGGQYFSIADLYQMSVTALAAKRTTGKLPESVRLARVFGPVDMTDDFGDNKGSVSRAGVERECSELAAAFNRPDWTPEPRNAIPTFVVVDAQPMNAASFLRILAQAITNPEENRFDIRVAVMLTPLGMNYPYTRFRQDFGAMWTLKPAPLRALQ